MNEKERCKKIFLDLQDLIKSKQYHNVDAYLQNLNNETSTISEIKSALIMTENIEPISSEDLNLFLNTRIELRKLMERKINEKKNIAGRTNG